MIILTSNIPKYTITKYLSEYHSVATHKIPFPKIIVNNKEKKNITAKKSGLIIYML